MALECRPFAMPTVSFFFTLLSLFTQRIQKFVIISLFLDTFNLGDGG